MFYGPSSTSVSEIQNIKLAVRERRYISLETGCHEMEPKHNLATFFHFSKNSCNYLVAMILGLKNQENWKFLKM